MTTNLSVLTSQIPQSTANLPLEANTSNADSPTLDQISFRQRISDLVIPILLGVAVGLVLIFGFGIEPLVAVGISFVATILTFCFGDKIGIVPNRTRAAQVTLTRSLISEQIPNSSEVVTAEQNPSLGEDLIIEQIPSIGEALSTEQPSSSDEITTTEQTPLTDEAAITGASTLDTNNESTDELSFSEESDEEENTNYPMLITKERTGLRWLTEQVVNLGEGVQNFLINPLS